MNCKYIYALPIFFFQVGCALTPSQDSLEITSLNKIIHEQQVKINELTQELQSVRQSAQRNEVLVPQGVGGAVSMEERIALPEKYIGKVVTMKGRLINPARFRGGQASFAMKDTDSHLNITCLTELSADDASKRLLVQKTRNSEMEVKGKLVKGPEWLHNHSEATGFTFMVDRVVK